MDARSLPGTDLHGGTEPLARWRLWAQVSNNGPMDFRSERGSRPVVLATDPYGHVILPLGARDASASTAADDAVMAEGALPLTTHTGGSTAVVLPAAATMWSDGDTMLDIRPEHWRPLTITLAPPAAFAPFSPPAAQHPLRVAAARAGWMLAGVALTFLAGAAALGGGPLIRVVRSTLDHGSASQGAVSTASAIATPPPVVAAPPVAVALPPAVAGPAVTAAPPLVATPATVAPAAIPPPAVAVPSPKVAPFAPTSVAVAALQTTELAAAAPAPDSNAKAAPLPAMPAVSKAALVGDPLALRRAARSERQPQRTLAQPPANRTETLRRIDFEDPFGTQ